MLLMVSLNGEWRLAEGRYLVDVQRPVDSGGPTKEIFSYVAECCPVVVAGYISRRVYPTIL